jgi:hypothetical protein
MASGVVTCVHLWQYKILKRWTDFLKDRYARYSFLLGRDDLKLYVSLCKAKSGLFHILHKLLRRDVLKFDKEDLNKIVLGYIDA